MEEKIIAMPPLPEEETEVVVQEGPTQEVEQEEAPKQEETVQQETTQQRNFKNLRLEKEQLEKDRNEMLKRLEQYEKPKVIAEEEDLNINIADDELFEGKHYRKLEKQLKKQQDLLETYQSQAKVTATESKLKSQYSDFDKVVNEDNINLLRETEPEIAAALASTPDIYNKAVSAYKMIKKLGIYVEDSYGSDRDIAIKNSLKPKPAASVSPQGGDSPLTKANAFANGLTPDLKRQLWKEMEEASKGN